MKRKGLLKGFFIFDLIIIALMAAIGIAIKPVIVPLAHVITGPLYIPGGAIAGGFYMLWMVLGVGIVRKRGTATLIALVQAIMIIALGSFGTHGILSFVTYILPGLAVDGFLILIGHKGCCVLCCFLSGMIANISGTFLVNVVFFQLPLIPLILSLSSAAFSGGIGGLIAHTILKQLRTFNIIDHGV